MEITIAATEPANEAQKSQQPEETKKNTRPKRRRRKRVRLGEAMRKIGLDEYTIAERMAGLIDNLGNDKSDAKVLLDALKESMRFLEPQKPAGPSESDTPTMVTLSHNVPRPARGTCDTSPDTSVPSGSSGPGDSPGGS